MATKQELNLARRIDSFCAECNAFIDSKAAELKNTPDGKGLPIGVLRMTLTGADHCACRVAKRLLGESQ